MICIYWPKHSMVCFFNFIGVSQSVSRSNLTSYQLTNSTFGMQNFIMNDICTCQKGFTWYWCPFNLAHHYCSWHSEVRSIQGIILGTRYLFFVYTFLSSKLLIHYHSPKLLKLYFKEDKQRLSNSVPSEFHGYTEKGRLLGKKCQTCKC